VLGIGGQELPRHSAGALHIVVCHAAPGQQRQQQQANRFGQTRIDLATDL
jgi:hypothetical protein